MDVSKIANPKVNSTIDNCYPEGKDGDKSPTDSLVHYYETAIIEKKQRFDFIIHTLVQPYY